MADPIDILAIAARRLHDAGAALRSAQQMQTSPYAAAATQAATDELLRAWRDMDAAQRLAMEIGEGADG